MEKTYLMFGLTRVVIGDCLVDLYSTGSILFAKDPLGSRSSSFGVLPQCPANPCPVHLQ